MKPRRSKMPITRRFIPIELLICTLVLMRESYGHIDIKVDVDMKKVLRQVDDRFLSLTLDTDIFASEKRWSTFNISSPLLQTLCKGLLPAYLRIGGTAEDFLHFQADGNASLYYGDEHENDLLNDMDGYNSQKDVTDFNMTGQQWSDMNKFTASVGLEVFFGFNLLLRKWKHWNPEDAIKILDYSQKRGFKLNFELGNEPNAFGKFGRKLNAEDIAKDFHALRSLLKHYPLYKTSMLVGPDVSGISKNKVQAIEFFETLVKYAFPELDAITFHQYYIDGRTAGLTNFTDPNLLDDLYACFERVYRIVKNYVPNPVIWLGETSSAWGGGAKGLSDRYVAGFMWLDKLGLSAKYWMDVVMRQSVYRGSYALLNDDYSPRPDYWVSLLFKRLVGKQVLNVTIQPYTNAVRLYAHCSRNAASTGAITLYGMNLLNVEVRLVLPQLQSKYVISKYLLTPPNGNLESQFIELNGDVLRMKDDWHFPDIIPEGVDSITIPSKTFGFFLLSNVQAKACS